MTFNVDDQRPWINVIDTGAPALDVDAIIRRADPPVIVSDSVYGEPTPVWVYAFFIALGVSAIVFAIIWILSGGN